MMAGIDSTFDGVLFTYHAAATRRQSLSHTMSMKCSPPVATAACFRRFDINAMIAAHYSVPGIPLGERGFAGRRDPAASENVGNQQARQRRISCIRKPPLANPRIRQTGAAVSAPDLYPIPAGFPSKSA